MMFLAFLTLEFSSVGLTSVINRKNELDAIVNIGEMGYKIDAQALNECKLNKEDILKILSEFDQIIGVGFEIKSIEGDIVRLSVFNDMLTDGLINASVAAKMTKLIGEIYTRYLDENFEGIYNGEFDPVSNLNRHKIKHILTSKLIMGD